MEIDDFKSGLVKYYGEHENKHVEKVTLRYISAHFDKSKLPALMTSIMRSHPVNYGFPDVAAIENAQDLLFKRDNKSLKKVILSNDEWQTNIAPLTEDERKEAEKNRNKWKDLVYDAEKGNKVKQDDKCQKCTHRTETGENFFCRGCISHNKFEPEDK